MDKLWYPYQGQFSDDLYTYGLYNTVGLVTLISSFLLCVLFYYIINSAAFNKISHWLLILMGGFAFNFMVGTFYPQRYLLNEANVEYDLGTTAMYGLVMALYSALFFFIFSMGIKWWSRNCSTTPF
jgi:divalent metal cation (Fe/Co/Zn/Cd) transporter